MIGGGDESRILFCSWILAGDSCFVRRIVLSGAFFRGALNMKIKTDEAIAIFEPLDFHVEDHDAPCAVCSGRVLATEVKTLRERLKHLSDALADYGEHLPSCPQPLSIAAAKPCDCGFDEAYENLSWHDGRGGKANG